MRIALTQSIKEDIGESVYIGGQEKPNDSIQIISGVVFDDDLPLPLAVDNLDLSRKGGSKPVSNLLELD